MILAVTLNHNQRELTDNLVQQLMREETDFGMWVVDNGSKKEEVSKYTAIKLQENIFFGGGFNHVLKKFIKMDEYDYMWFLNNDMIFNGYNILTQMEDIANEKEYDLLSPSITTSEIRQCYWKQMWCWNTRGTRDVKWIDFQAPLMSKRLAKEIVQFPQKLHMGWGLDFYAGILCERKEWKVGVTDEVNLVHLDSRTLKDGKVEGWDVDSYSQRADMNMKQYFIHSDMREDFVRFRKWSENYKV